MRKLCSTVITLLALALSHPAAVQAGPRAFPSWDKKFANGRFVVLTQFGRDAVYDKETGLVWEQAPSPDVVTWFDALSHCYEAETGGRQGWRLPTIEELASLVDPTVPGPGPRLPVRHPFTGVQAEFKYWSATTLASNTSRAWGVDFGSLVGDDGKANGGGVWCVRGGQGVDGVQ